MKYLIVFCLVIFCLQSKGQTILDTIANSYLQSTNQLYTLQQIKSYRALIDLPSVMGDDEEYEPATSYFKLSYPPANNEPGLLEVRYNRNLGSKTRTIEQLLDFYSSIISQDQDETDVVEGVEKNGNVHGCFIFVKGDPCIYLFLLKQPTMDIVRVVIEIDNLTPSQMEALARDFIQNTSYIY